MKINDLKNNRLSESRAAKKTAASGATSFFELLSGQIAPGQEAAPTASSGEIAETSDIPSQLRFQGISLSEETINLLETYSKALANLHLNIEDLGPIIEAMEDDTTALLDIKEQLDDSDPLAKLIDHVTTISYIEAEKYRRGDYGN